MSGFEGEAEVGPPGGEPLLNAGELFDGLGRGIGPVDDDAWAIDLQALLRHLSPLAGVHHVRHAQGAEVLLRERTNSWMAQRESRLLLSFWEYFTILRHTKRRTWTASQASMMRASGRRHLGSICVWGGVIALLLIVGFELRGRVRAETLTRRVRRDSLKDDVLSMRARMRKELDKSDSSTFDLKQGVGGIGYIEFLVQYLVLRNADQYPSVYEFTDNIRQLDALADCSIVSGDTASTLQDIYRRYRLCQHHLVLDDESSQVAGHEFVDERALVVNAWHEVFGT